MTFSDIVLILHFSFPLWYLLLLPLPKEPHFPLSLIRSLIPCNSPLCSPPLLYLPPCLLPKDAFHFSLIRSLAPCYSSLYISSQPLYPWKVLYFGFCRLYTYIWRLELEDSNERQYVTFFLSGSGLPHFVGSFLISSPYPNVHDFLFPHG